MLIISHSAKFMYTTRQIIRIFKRPEAKISFKETLLEGEKFILKQ